MISTTRCGFSSVVGPAWLIQARVGLAAIFLWMVATWFKKGLQASQHWRHYLVLGFFNSALPFLLFAYAAQTISASLLSILNATAPMWAAAEEAVSGAAAASPGSRVRCGASAA